ncbi:ABC transporter ATP-binding protein [Shewanella sp. 10N.286.52.B9]|uniref:ABC transporter ATP-binding protein n=1 Tax=Shewanella sp. 10N.286.52.B9 TaxID=1880837 RepID=UPI000C84829C|nr:ABC transporter ATP-binding protein [Shewanella sp. 10N.286.52.B9]PMG51922.1 ABC transporter [Shewanella sp. 10N.286.52.B9]
MTVNNHTIEHLSVNNLSWSCADKNVLQQLNFKVNKGETIGILGPNGVGKSTLLRCIYKYLKPSTGEIYLDGVNINDISRRQFSAKVAVVLQHPPSGFSVTCRQLLATGLVSQHKWWQAIDYKKEQRVIDEVLEQVNLSDKGEHIFEHLSGGEKQRLLIGRALLQKPEILLLDEPTNHLDIRYQLEVLTLIKSLNITVIATIHDLNLASAFCDQMLFLKEGRLVKNGPPSAVMSEDNIRHIYGVNAHIDRHPTNENPRITYHYSEALYAAV